MIIAELSQDKLFLQGLRDGDYCLVLGAGFSFNLKNKTSSDSLQKIKRIKYEDFKNIPLVNSYISLTNKIFNDNVSKGEAAANIWENYEFSIKENNEIVDLKTFYQNLFTVDEDWFRENKLKLYKNILLPNWYQVYTFNFDNVFESIVKLRERRDYYSLHFPEHSGIVRTNNKAIIHLHGYISKTSPKNLTFSDRTYNVLRDKKHTLYDQFYSDVNAGKNLVIIGTQFDEKVIDDKFFSGLENKGITIYHFDLSNENFKTKPGIAKNNNYQFIKINDIDDVFNFLEEQKDQIENIRIGGAVTVNEDFVNKIREEGDREGFKASDFYLAKQVDQCQWYGVTQNWVVEPENYKYIKQEVVLSFADSKRNSKISALVWGKGGSGKSTLLRKLAVDLCKKEFAVLWIKDIDMQKFFEEGLPQIWNSYQQKKFLIVIEDLYRVKQQSDIKLKEIFYRICSSINVRVIISDRSNDDGSYREHIYDPDKNIYELTVDNNKKTLDELLTNIPEWKDVADSLLTSDEDYKSSLYYILWVIGRTVQKKEEGISVIKNQDLCSHFRSLVESDLKALAANYPGISKMLYYWANLYIRNKIFISYDLFFKLADKFSEPSADESRLILSSPSHKSILDIYIHKADNLKKSAVLPLLAFNHDILAEDGLSKVKLTEWHPFDDSIQLKMLKVIIKEGDNISASVFVSHCLNHIPNTVSNKLEKKRWIYQLKTKGNFNSYLFIAMSKDYLSINEKYELSNEILRQDNFWNLPPRIVCMALNITEDKFKACEILKQDDFLNLPPELVCAALSLSGNKIKADEILKQDSFWNLPHEIVCAALSLSNNKIKADEILKQDSFWNLPPEIVCAALSLSNNKIKADEILKQDSFWNLPHEIVCVALSLSKNKTKADEILKQDSFWNLPHEIVCVALSLSKNKTKADEILKQDNYLNFHFSIVCTALTISDNEFLKEKVAQIFIASNKWKEKWNLTYQILCFYSKNNKIPSEIVQIIREIIADFLNKRNFDKGKKFRYMNLMKIPFHSISVWKESSLINIDNWQTRPRILVTNTILAYRSEPSRIEKMCKSILENWRTEIIRLTKVHGKDIHYVEHICLSMGHPSLKELATKTAAMIKMAGSESLSLIPENLLDITNQIIDEKQFPEWNSNENLTPRI